MDLQRTDGWKRNDEGKRRIMSVKNERRREGRKEGRNVQWRMEVREGVERRQQRRSKEREGPNVAREKVRTLVCGMEVRVAIRGRERVGCK